MRSVDDGFVIADSGSAGGTYVDDAQVRGLHRLVASDVIQCGSIRLRFVVAGAGEPGAPPRSGRP